MWRSAVLRIPETVQPVNCSVINVHGWTFNAGRVEESGHYLSPENAIHYLSQELTQSSHNGDVVIFMIASHQQDLFIESLANINRVFPIGAFKQAERLTRSEIALNKTKMQQPGNYHSELPSIPLTVSTWQKALSTQSINKFNRSTDSIDKLTVELILFKARQAEKQAIKRAEIEALKQLQAPVFVFTATDPATRISAMIKKNIPDDSAIYSAAVMFLGSDLSALRAMII